MSSLDAETDELARRIERRILRNEDRLDALPEFDDEWRREAASSVPDAEELFS